MPSLTLGRKKTTAYQFCEVTARRLWRDICDTREFSGRQRDPAHQA
jgi:hypothetical protein